MMRIDDSSFHGTLVERVSRYAPTVGFVVAIAVVGLVASMVARRIVTALVRRSGLEAFAERAGISKTLYAVGVKSGIASALGTLTYTAGLLITFSAASDVLGLTVVSTLATKFLGYLPRLLSAAAILIGTGVGASVVRAFVDRMTQKRSDVDSPKAASKLAHAIIWVIGFVLAAEQTGVEIAFLTTLLQVAVAVLGLGFAIAFGLGFYTVFRNMAARHYYRPLLQVGDVVKIGEDEGTVLRFGPTALVLRTAEGDRIVPCERFLRATVLVRATTPSTPS